MYYQILHAGGSMTQLMTSTTPCPLTAHRLISSRQVSSHTGALDSFPPSHMYRMSVLLCWTNGAGASCIHVLPGLMTVR